ncbi:PVC-type heme-binding CxxCH protein [Negadavirga shengliensis]|uniref:PVC-type heme-binding CxxCH protein n=1 Tax=Negadavirga shengliensis TaxID=1389218 RepID=A0ABV9T5R8_9BACT
MKGRPSGITESCFTLISFVLIVMSCQSSLETTYQTVEGVKVLDSRLELTLMKEDPAIVTPIGIAVDENDRIFVLESHTHQPPRDYEGPEHDIIKIYEDTNGDGEWDKETEFATGIIEGLNLAFSPEGHLHVVTSRDVWALYDKDGDGVSEEREKLVGLVKPDYVYAHAAILSITFDTEGWMYIGRGNTGGAHWIFEAKDGSRVEGYGDGGNIMRAKTDGSQLEEFATGFWNPFDLKFDNYGRLLVADNDPDSRGPNRLVHAVLDADFGYQSLFGGSGIHPYLAWNGELPGTLPYAVALGEAPSGLLNANLGGLPADYHDQMLCTIWEESRIVSINLTDQGLSVKGDTEIVLEGGPDFRPVAFATDSKGNVFITDWVLRYYPNHGRGRIWKLSARKGIELLEKRNLYDRPLPHPKVEELGKLLTGEEWDVLIENLVSDDPYARHTAIRGLGREKFWDRLVSSVGDPDPAVRLGILLSLKKTDHPEKELLARQFLEDEDAEIRSMAMIWVGQEGMVGLRPHLEKALEKEGFSPAHFETYLETIKLLQPEFLEAYSNKTKTVSKNIPRNLPENFIASLLADKNRPSNMKAAALRYLEHPADHIAFLLEFLEKERGESVRLEIIRTLSDIPDKEVAESLLAISMDAGQPASQRAEALLSLSGQPLDNWQRVIPLLEAENEHVRIEAARYLQSRAGDDEVKAAMQRLLAKVNQGKSEAFYQQLILAVEQQLPGRPENQDLEKWQTLLDGQGDQERGRRVFFSQTALCATCHAVNGRGGDLGPDLTNVGKSKDRRGLISSLLLPSQEISPEWQGWYIKLSDGTYYEGRQIDVGNDDIKLYTQAKGFISVDKKDIADYGMSAFSLMPDGLEQRLTDQDLKDLLAFLEGK